VNMNTKYLRTNYLFKIWPGGNLQKTTYFWWLKLEFEQEQTHCVVQLTSVPDSIFIYLPFWLPNGWTYSCVENFKTFEKYEEENLSLPNSTLKKKLLTSWYLY
jgi:hypothetical protein